MNRVTVAVLVGLSASPALAQAQVTLNCPVSNHFIAKNNGKIGQEETHAFTRNFTLNPDGTFVMLTTEMGTVLRGTFTTTPKRYVLQFAPKPDVDYSGYIDRETGALYTLYSTPIYAGVITEQDHGTCTPERGTPKF